MSKNNKKPSKWYLVSGKYNLILGLFILLVNLGLVYIVYGINAYSNLSKTIFIIVDIICVLLLLILNISYIICL